MSSQPAAPARIADGPVTFFSRVYHDYWAYRGLWLGITIPAFVVSAVVDYGARYKIAEVMNRIPHGPDAFRQMWLFAEIGLFRFGAEAIAWLVACFSFGAVAAAVAIIRTDDQRPGVEEAYSTARERLAPLISAGAIVGLMLLASALAAVAPVLLLPRASLAVLNFVSYGILAASIVMVFQFQMAIPAVVISDLSPRRALRLSYEIAQTNTANLVLLVVKSAVGGWLAGNVLFWIFGAYSDRPWVPWLLWLGAGMLVAFAEVVVMIGFSQMYLDAGGQETATLSAP